MLSYRIGWWENLQEPPIFHGKTIGYQIPEKIPVTSHMTPVRRPPPGAGLELPQRQSSRYTDILNWYMLRRSIHDEDYEDYDDDDDDDDGLFIHLCAMVKHIGFIGPWSSQTWWVFGKTSSNWLMTIPLYRQFILDLTLAHMTSSSCRIYPGPSSTAYSPLAIPKMPPK